MSEVTRKSTPTLRVIAASLVVTLAAALAALTLQARAADEATATYICRPAAAGGPSNAKMTAGATLECHVVSMALKMSNGKMETIGQASSHMEHGPDLSHALTPGQINDAYVKWIEAMFNITHTP
jgi:hypothetical protein